MSRLIINSDKFAEVLEPLQAVVNSAHMVPILRTVKIEVGGDELIVTGDNHEVRCSNAIDFESDETMCICVDFQLLLTALKSIKNQDIEVEVDKTAFLIYHNQGDFKIPLEEVSAFPDPKIEKLQLSAKVDSSALKSSLKIANKFILNDDLEPMSNMSIEIGKKVIIRSTNKISLFQEKIKGKGDKSNLLISGKTSAAIQFLLEDDEALNLKYNDTMIFFKFGKKEVTAIQQQGQFPLSMFNKIMDTFKDAEKLEIDQDKFVTSIKRVSSLSGKEKVQVMRMNIDKKSLNMSCINIATQSKVQENLDVKFKGKALIGFNSKLLSEIIGVFDKNCEFSINKAKCFCIKSKKKMGLMAPFGLQE
jgi:DNA polymerase III sliding clamp (beta) subunit (PCNA family)